MICTQKGKWRAVFINLFRLVGASRSAAFATMQQSDDARARAFFDALMPHTTREGTPRDRLTATHDLLNLPSLTVPSMRAALEHRHEKQVVYSLTGDVVVSVNPFKDVGAVGPSSQSRAPTHTATRTCLR